MIVKLSAGQRRDRNIASHLDYLGFDSLIFQKAFLKSERK
jgi:hypothetical protein